MKCRFCRTPLRQVFCDLGATAVSNAFLTREALDGSESIYPLVAYVCEACLLVQVGETRDRESLFTQDYVYSSSIAKSWVEHCRVNVEALVKRFSLGASSHVVEVASNDGYLLQFFKERGIPCLGIEPTASTASLARQKGIETVVEFFEEGLAGRLADSGKSADLVIGNNVLAHVPDLHVFVSGFRRILKPDGVLVMEFPHLAKLVEHVEFDTIYHEHYSYFSLYAVENVFARHALSLFDVEELPTHGGSLRIYAQRKDAPSLRPESARLGELRALEASRGLTKPGGYEGFQVRVDAVKNDLLEFLIRSKREGKRVVGFGAAAKGNTFLNYAGVRSDLLAWVADDTPFKQGRYLPQSRIPVVHPDRLAAEKPDVILFLPWNFRDDLSRRLAFTREWGARFVTALPRLEVF